MKLLRHGNAGNERPGIMDADGNIRDLAGIIDDLSGAALGDNVLQRLRDIDPSTLPMIDQTTRIGPCVGHVGK